MCVHLQVFSTIPALHQYLLQKLKHSMMQRRSSAIRPPRSQLGSTWVNHDGMLDSINFYLKRGAGETCQILQPLTLFIWKFIDGLEHIKLLHVWFYFHTHTHAHTHAQPLMYLQLAGRWPIKRLIAVQREQAIRPPSDPGTTVQAGRSGRDLSDVMTE